jgi:hypothetical protein
MSALTSGLGAYGKFRTYSGAVVAVIVSLSLCFLGGYMIKNPDKHTASVQGTVKEVTTTKDSNGNPSYSIVGEYNIGGKVYAVSGQTDQIYNKGQAITVYYDPANPGSALLKPYPKWLGWSMISGASLLTCCAVGFAYFFSTLSNTGKATVGGLQAAGNAWSIFRSD